ncbi:MAG: hypothetical protein EOQ55_27210 [Mesorhizobium sp.]|uniref:hypothetical protein n=1 Tax=Mesorhizobium sp. TaxID=1871066 RepID=UPI000FEA7B54|nr:hypothetical protein [Mesorhizobium sp.]RWG12244.1 MAG: hypothetical protein EOQ55_27210 [Mesorhizobium sp.]
MLPEIHFEKSRVPPVLLKPCGDPWHKPGKPANAPAGGAETVADLYTRGDVNEQRLNCANAKQRGVGEWDKQ